MYMHFVVITLFINGEPAETTPKNIQGMVLDGQQRMVPDGFSYLWRSKFHLNRGLNL